MKTVCVIGASHESLNTAIWLASMGHTVKMSAAQGAIEQVLAHYKFDQQMTALWQMYRGSGQIVLVENNDAADMLWLFVDAVTTHDITRYCQQFSAAAMVILSGSLAIGQLAALANLFETSHVCYVPFVFMKDGMGFVSISKPDLLLIGEKKRGVHQRNAVILSLLAKAQCHYVTDIHTVEFARASIMAMLAARLSFMNEMARLADANAVDIGKVQTILGLDKRIGDDYLSASWGFGGQTLPTELQLLEQLFAENKVESRLLATVSQINEDQKELIFRKFWRYFDGFIEDKTVTIWGAGYRAGTGRTTHSAIHPLLKLLWSYNIKTRVYAPNAGFELDGLYGGQPLFELIADPYQLQGSDVLFIINWSEPILPDVEKLNRFAIPIFDGKNLFDDAMLAALVSDYHGIGRNVQRSKK